MSKKRGSKPKARTPGMTTHRVQGKRVAKSANRKSEDKAEKKAEEDKKGASASPLYHMLGTLCNWLISTALQHGDKIARIIKSWLHPDE